MESNSGFDLKRAVAQWRLELSANPAVGLDESAEMERRLRAFVVELQARGLTPKEAFLLARSRIDGRALDADEVDPTKVGSVWRQRLLWMLATVLGWQLLYLTLVAASGLLEVFCGSRIKPGVGTAIFLGSLILSHLALIAGSFFLYRRASAALVWEKWIGRLGFGRKAGYWCGALLVFLISLAILIDWCGSQLRARSPYRYRLTAMAPPPQEHFDLRLLSLTSRVGLPILAGGLLVYMIVAARRSAAFHLREAGETSGSTAPKGDSAAISRAIESWRRRLAGHDGVTSEQAREISSHLHDSTERFIRAGLPSDESLWLAKRRLGRASDIAAQFQRENTALIWRIRLLWAWSGLALLLGMEPMIGRLLGLVPNRWAAPILFLVNAGARPAAMWAVICVLLLSGRKLKWPTVRPAQALRLVSLGFVAVGAPIVFSTGGADAMWSAILGLRGIPETVISREFNQFIAQSMSLFPTKDFSGASWLAWVLLGHLTQNVLIVGSVYLLLRPTTDPSPAELRLEEC